MSVNIVFIRRFFGEFVFKDLRLDVKTEALCRCLGSSIPFLGKTMYIYVYLQIRQLWQIKIKSCACRHTLTSFAPRQLIFFWFCKVISKSFFVFVEMNEKFFYMFAFAVTIFLPE